MKSNELKIGNWLLPNHDLDGDYSQVSSLEVCYEGGKHYIVNGYKDGFFYNPIPLTPEILEKAGFKKGGFGSTKISIKNNLLIEIDCVQQITVVSNDKGEILIVPYVQPLHLHQLQNLYFALTGEELPIEL